MHTNAFGEVEASQPPVALSHDGERFLPDMRGRIAAEHLLRYNWATSFVQDRDVLDVACGEGYGSNLLAGLARRVVGADVASVAINYARTTYQRANLTYDIAEITALPYAEDSFDVITCFETIEHVDQVQIAVSELRRVLRPEGILLISTPNTDIYTKKYNYINNFHKSEMNIDEFLSVLLRYFPAIKMAGQASSFASLITGLPNCDDSMVDRRAFKLFPEITDQAVADVVVQYFVAICSSRDDGRPIGSAVYCDASDDSDIVAEMRAARAAQEASLSSSDEGITFKATLPQVHHSPESEVAPAESTDNVLQSSYELMRRKHDLLRDGRRIEQAQKNAEISALKSKLERYVENTTVQFQQLQAEHSNLWKLNDGLRRSNDGLQQANDGLRQANDGLQQAMVSAESARDKAILQCTHDLDSVRSQAQALRDRLLHLQSYAAALANQTPLASAQECFVGNVGSHPGDTPELQGGGRQFDGRVAAPRLRSKFLTYLGGSRWGALLKRQNR